MVQSRYYAVALLSQSAQPWRLNKESAQEIIARFGQFEISSGGKRSRLLPSIAQAGKDHCITTSDRPFASRAPKPARRVVE